MQITIELHTNFTTQPYSSANLLVVSEELETCKHGRESIESILKVNFIHNYLLHFIYCICWACTVCMLWTKNLRHFPVLRNKTHDYFKLRCNGSLRVVGEFKLLRGTLILVEKSNDMKWRNNFWNRTIFSEVIVCGYVLSTAVTLMALGYHKSFQKVQSNQNYFLDRIPK